VTVEPATVLAGDIGGTKTRLALFTGGGTQPVCQREQTYTSRRYAALDTIISEFLAGGAPPAAACFGIAGPVRDNTAATTNLPWRINAAALASRFGITRVSLLNDLEATAWGIGALDAADFHTLNRGRAAPAGNAAIIAAGTGLGEAGLYHDGTRLRPFATEGGHTDFSPGNEQEMALLRFLQVHHEHVSWERVVSGPGLVTVHAFLCAEQRQAIPDWLEAATAEGDPAAAIAAAAQDGSDPVCGAALRLFTRLYGREAGNLALKILATGGLYLGGGIAPKILASLQGIEFMQTFCAKGRMRPLLEAMPVRVILNDRAALLGAAVFAATTAVT
jgi:glucokinase